MGERKDSSLVIYLIEGLEKGCRVSGLGSGNSRAFVSCIRGYVAEATHLELAQIFCPITVKGS